MHFNFRRTFSFFLEQWSMFKCSESSNNRPYAFRFFPEESFLPIPCKWSNTTQGILHSNYSVTDFTRFLASSEHSFFLDEMPVILKHKLLSYCLFSSNHCRSIFFCWLRFLKCCWRIGKMGYHLELSLISFRMISLISLGIASLFLISSIRLRCTI